MKLELLDWIEDTAGRPGRIGIRFDASTRVLHIEQGCDQFTDTLITDRWRRHFHIQLVNGTIGE